MARARRRISESGIYKVSLRGNDAPLFVGSADYDEFTALMGKYFGSGVMAFSLAEDSAELMVKIENDSISSAMKPFLTSYARYYNRTYCRAGKVFRDRYKSEPVEESEAAECAEEILGGARSGNSGDVLGMYQKRSGADTDAQARKDKDTDKDTDTGGNNGSGGMDVWLL